MKNSSTSKIWLLIIIFVVAALRIYWLQFWSQTPYWTGFFLDELYHHLWAQKIADGQIMPLGVFFRAPFYPYILGVIYSIFGDNPSAPRIFMLIWGVLSILPVWLVAQRTLKSNVAIIFAVMLWAFNPIQIFFESRLLLDAFFTAGIPWLFYMLLLARQKRNFLSIIACGLILGILAITRPTILIFMPVMIFWLWKYLHKKALWALLALIAVIAPVTIANISNDDTVLIASQGGINFYIGNNHKSDGISAIVPEFGFNWQYRQCAALAERETDENLSPSGVSGFYFKRGIEFWRTEPKSAILLTIRKLYVLLSATEYGNNGNIYFLTRNSFMFYLIMLGFGWGIILPFMLLGLFAGKLENRPLFSGFLLLYAAAIIAFFVCSRLRLPLLPIAVIFAGAGIDFLINSAGKKRLYAIISLVTIFFLITIDPFGWRKFEDPLSHFSLGNIYARQSKPAQARAEYFRALKLKPDTRGAHLNIGVIHLKAGELDTAEYHYKKEIEVDGDVCSAYSNLGVLARLKSDFTLALAYGEKAYLLCPENPTVAYNFAFSLQKTKYTHHADSVLCAMDEDIRNDMRISNLHGAIKLELGDTSNAVAFFERVIASTHTEEKFAEMYDIGTTYSEQVGFGASPKRVKCWAYFNLAQISIARTEHDTAEEYMNIAVAIDSTFAQGWALIGIIALANGHLDDAEEKMIQAESLELESIELFFNLASIKARTGDFEAAKVYLKNTLQLEPNFIPAQEALKALENSEFRM